MISLFDLFSIGVGPSSSHTVGPMRAAYRFVNAIDENVEGNLDRVTVELYGSLALTGVGHGTDTAVLMGLEGELPESIEIEEISSRLDRMRSNHVLLFRGQKELPFHEDTDLLFHKEKVLPYHTNGLRFRAYQDGQVIFEKVYYSVGGGFVVEHSQAKEDTLEEENSVNVPYPFESAYQLIQWAKRDRKTIAEIVLENEKCWRSEADIRAGVLNIWKVMERSVQRGCRMKGELPGGLKVKRRAAELYTQLSSSKQEKTLSLRQSLNDPAELFDWVSLWALAVNEENAAGGRVVTAPTNGAAGIIPAVIHYYVHFVDHATEQGIVDLMLTASAIGVLYKLRASISAAEVGCQGEVGVACSMAAAGLCAVQGGDVDQVENAAEIGMEHNLGLTCDPVAGLVQIPCIERNTMGAIKAINAARLALKGDGSQKVSLDAVIETMRQTGADMQTIYKETAQGGLAVNIVAC